MPNRRSTVRPPRDYVSGEWPYGLPVADAPRALQHARAISLRLVEALEGRNVSEVAQQADLARSTLYDLAQGRTWPDLISLGKLEDALGVPLLPALPRRDGAA